MTSVTYGGSAMAFVDSATGTDSDEDGQSQLWFLGTSVPTGAQTVEVTRTNDTDRLYAVAATVTAGGDTEVYAAGISKFESLGALGESAADDGSPGTNSQRFSCAHSGLATPPANGANSTGMGTAIDFGAQINSVFRETTAGQGSRNVGWNDAGSDDRAAIFWAVRQVTAGGASGAPRLLLTGVGE